MVLGEGELQCRSLVFTVLIQITAANFAAYTFAPPILVTPLGALTVIIGCVWSISYVLPNREILSTSRSAILASFLLNEELGHIGRVGCTLCLLGSLIIVLHAPPDKDIQTVDEILHYALQPGACGRPHTCCFPTDAVTSLAGFLLYCFTVVVFSLVMIYTVAPRYGRSNAIVYISICSVVGSVSVMSIKGFGVALKLTLAGNNQFSHPSTYVFGIVTISCIVVQMNYFNKALDTFSTNVSVHGPLLSRAAPPAYSSATALTRCTMSASRPPLLLLQ